MACREMAAAINHPPLQGIGAVADWRTRLGRLASAVESTLDEQREKLGLGAPRPVRIEAYRGYGRADQGWFRARVLRGAPPPRAR
jgi:hypothetical protein